MLRLPRPRTICVRGLLAATLALAPVLAPAQDAATELGRQVFTAEAQPQCSICHSLTDAGAVGELGPDLDELRPDEAMVRAAVARGVGVMPAYDEILSEDQIAAVARYVATAAGRAD